MSEGHILSLTHAGHSQVIRNWQSWLYDIWRLKLGIHLYAIQRVQWQLEFFGDVDGPEEPEEEP